MTSNIELIRKKGNCFICGERIPLVSRRVKYCRKCDIKRKTKIRNCKICGKEFENKSQGKYCMEHRAL